MRTIDERISLPFDVSKDDLDEIAREIGVKITTAGDVIILEGDEAEVDVAAGMIAQLPKKKPYEDVEDPYASLKAGQRYSDKKGQLPDEYSVYDLIAEDEKTGNWHCKVTTYYFNHAPYRPAFTNTEYADIKPEELLKMRLTKHRK